MASSRELIQQRNSYYVLRDNVSNLISNVNKTYNSIASADRIRDSFTINDNPADNGEISQVKDEIGSIKEKLSSTVISEINNKIDSLGRQIEAAIAREEAEARERERISDLQ